MFSKEINLQFEIDWKSVHLADIEWNIYMDKESYSIDFIIQSYGMTDKIFKYKSVTNIEGLIKKGYLTPEIHFIRHEQFRIADGNTVEGGIWRIPKIKIGSETIYNVEFSSVSSENAPFLLGMSTLERLGTYSIVPNENKIIITTK